VPCPSLFLLAPNLVVSPSPLEALPFVWPSLRMDILGHSSGYLWPVCRYFSFPDKSLWVSPFCFTFSPLLSPAFSLHCYLLSISADGAALFACAVGYLPTLSFTILLLLAFGVRGALLPLYNPLTVFFFAIILSISGCVFPFRPL
jgi:hypothetical protein